MTDVYLLMCRHCEDGIANDHPYEHPGLCCDCYDLSFGASLDSINKEREAKGKKPITKEWPRETT